jgi:energy-coupling factor transporter ATP-binding protein EcfA2
MKIVSLTEFSLSYTKDSPPALNGINFDLNSRESVVVSGLSGSGKSTLCLAIAGLTETFPAMTFKGVIRRSDGANGERARVGIVLQNFYSQITYLRSTVMEEIAFSCENLGLPRQETVRRVSEAIDMVRIGHLADRSPLELSGGEKQKVVLAAAIAGKPDLLVLDEPLSQLDPESTAYLGGVLTELKREMALLIAENDPYFILKVADRLVVLSEGKIVADGPPEEAITRSSVAYLDLPAWTMCVAKADEEGITRENRQAPPYELNYRKAISALKGPN